MTIHTWCCKQFISKSNSIHQPTNSLVLVWGTRKGEFVCLSIFRTFSFHRTRRMSLSEAATSSYTFRLGDLPKLDLQVDQGLDFRAWRTQWNSYVSLSGLSTEPPTKQVQALMLCFSHETLTENLGLTTEQRKDGEATISAIKRYIDGHINESVEWHNSGDACSNAVKPLMTS